MLPPNPRNLLWARLGLTKSLQSERPVLHHAILLRPNGCLSTHLSTFLHNAFWLPALRFVMPGIPYVPKDVIFEDEEDAQILAGIKARRPSRLSVFDRVLLHAPKIAGPWLDLASAVRFKTSLPDSIREAAISRVYALNNVEEEWKVHSGYLLRSTDATITAQFVDFVKTCPAGQILANYQAADIDEKYVAVLDLADASTSRIQVPPETLDAAKKFFSSKELVELAAAIALHNAVGRVFGVFDIKL